METWTLLLTWNRTHSLMILDTQWWPHTAGCYYKRTINVKKKSRTATWLAVLSLQLIFHHASKIKQEFWDVRWCNKTVTALVITLVNVNTNKQQSMTTVRACLCFITCVSGRLAVRAVWFAGSHTQTEQRLQACSDEHGGCPAQSPQSAATDTKRGWR